MQPIEIRIATEADAALIASISRETFNDTFGPQNTKADIDKYMDEQFTTAMLMAEVGTKNNIFLIASIAGITAGYVRLKDHSFAHGMVAMQPIEIARFYAVPAMIGKGVGKAMMQYCIAFALQLGKDIIWLGVWEQNQRAIDFYASFGFKKFGEHGFLLGNDLQTDWLMQRLI